MNDPPQRASRRKRTGARPPPRRRAEGERAGRRARPHTYLPSVARANEGSVRLALLAEAKLMASRARRRRGAGLHPRTGATPWREPTKRGRSTRRERPDSAYKHISRAPRLICRQRPERWRGARGAMPAPQRPKTARRGYRGGHLCTPAWRVGHVVSAES